MNYSELEPSQLELPKDWDYTVLPSSTTLNKLSKDGFESYHVFYCSEQETDYGVYIKHDSRVVTISRVDKVVACNCNQYQASKVICNHIRAILIHLGIIRELEEALSKPKADEPLVLRQLREIEQLAGITAGLKQPEKAKTRLLELKKRYNNPEWHKYHNNVSAKPDHQTSNSQ